MFKHKKSKLCGSVFQKKSKQRCGARWKWSCLYWDIMCLVLFISKGVVFPYLVSHKDRSSRGEEEFILASHWPCIKHKGVLGTDSPCLLLVLCPICNMTGISYIYLPELRESLATNSKPTNYSFFGQWLTWHCLSELTIQSKKLSMFAVQTMNIADIDNTVDT